MRKRKFGKGRLILNTDHNLAQNYTELNLRELAMDGGIVGIITGGNVTPYTGEPHTVLIDPITARAYNGERIVVESSTGLNVKPVSGPGYGREMYVTVYAEYEYVLSESDFDGDGILYYKDYTNGFNFGMIEGNPAPTGTAVKPTVPANTILVCDILYTADLYLSGVIQQSDIDFSRQDYYSDISFTELTVEKTSEFKGLATFKGGVDLSGSGLENIADPTTGSGVGDRDYNDARYLKTSGGTLVGNLTAPNISVSNALSVTGNVGVGGDVKVTGDIDCDGSLDVQNIATVGGDLFVTGATTVHGETVEGDLDITGDLDVTGASASISGNLTVQGNTDITGTVNVVGDITAQEDVSIGGDLVVDGLATLPNGIATSGGMVVSGGLVNNGNVTVNGNEVVVGNVSVDGTVTTKAVKVTWAPFTSYAIGDIVEETVRLFKCIVAHTSSANFSSDAANWQIMSNVSGPTISVVDNFASFAVTTGSVLKDSGYNANSFALASKGVTNGDLHDHISGRGAPITEGALSLIDTSTGNATTARHGFAPKAPNDVTKFLTGALTWVTPDTSSYKSNTSPTSDVYELAVTSTGAVNPLTCIVSNTYMDAYYRNTWVASAATTSVAKRNPGCAGVYNAAICFGGEIAGPALTNVTEAYNGSSWSTATGTLNTSRKWLAGCGVMWGALSIAGYTTTYSAVCEKYTGAAWVATGSLAGAARDYLGGCGSVNAALAVGGYTGAASAVVDKYSGATWATSGSLNTARYTVGACGTVNAAVAFGGYISASSAVVERYNGAVWVTSASAPLIGALTAARAMMGYAGVVNSAYVFGGYLAATTATTEKFNGAYWASGPAMLVAKQDQGHAGQSNAAISFAGSTTNAIGGIVNTMEVFLGTFWFGLSVYARSDNANTPYTEFYGATGDLSLPFVLASPGYIIASIDIDLSDSDEALFHMKNLGLEYVFESAWVASNSLNTARQYLAGAGTRNAALSFGGYTAGGYVKTTEKYNGSSWVATGDLNTSTGFNAGAGTQNAALSFGGTINEGTPSTATTEKFSGSAWSVSGSLSAAKFYLGGSGVQNAALSFGGSAGGSVSATAERFNGSSWTATSSLNTARSALGGSGSQNSTLCYGGLISSTVSAVVEKYNGVSWATFASINNARSDVSGVGVQNSVLLFGGYTTAITAMSERYNGYIWAHAGPLNTARRSLAGAGVSSSALSFGGITAAPAIVGATDEFRYSHGGVIPGSIQRMSVDITR